jgi:hypothetical protein
MQKFLYTISILLCVITANAQLINHDSTYNGIGRRICEYCPVGNYTHSFEDLLLDKNQNTIAVGSIGGGHIIAKIKFYGSLDTTFGNHTLGLKGLSEVLFFDNTGLLVLKSF